MPHTPPRISVLSTEYVRVPVVAHEAGELVDPTAEVVEMAFVVRGTEPTDDDWREADWETDSTVTPDRYSARCLVGPDGTGAVAAGSYKPWVRIGGPSPEIPVIEAEGSIRFF